MDYGYIRRLNVQATSLLLRAEGGALQLIELSVVYLDNKFVDAEAKEAAIFTNSFPYGSLRSLTRRTLTDTLPVNNEVNVVFNGLFW